MSRYAQLMLVMISLIGRAFSQDRGALEKQLKAALQGKTVVVRNFYDGGDLHYDQSGQIKGDVPSGPWTLLAHVRVDHVHMGKDDFEISGQRIFVKFDGPNDKRKPVEVKSDTTAKIHIDFPSGTADETLLAALKRVLLGGNEQLMDVAPPYWQSYLRGTSAAVPKETLQGIEVKKVGGPVHAPTTMFSPDPAYNAVAVAFRFQGKLVLSGVVDTDGWMKQVQIASPVGFGLDERGVAAAQTWRFAPATQDGKPVPVRITIEINFHIS
jgi:TonB family protein